MGWFGKSGPKTALKTLEEELKRLHRLASGGWTADRDYAQKEIAKINDALIQLAVKDTDSRIKALEDAVADLYLITERKKDEPDKV